jgi:hypothetical protein
MLPNVTAELSDEEYMTDSPVAEPFGAESAVFEP